MLFGERDLLGDISRKIRIWRPILSTDATEWVNRDNRHFDHLIGEDNPAQTKQWLLKTLDDRLNILDAKFAGILQLDAVFTAVTVFLLREVVADSQDWVRITGTVLFVISIYFLFSSIWQTRHRLFTRFVHLEAGDVRTYQRRLSELTHERLREMDAAHFAALWGGIFIALFALLVSGQKLGIWGEKPVTQHVYIENWPSPAVTPQGAIVSPDSTRPVPERRSNLPTPSQAAPPVPAPALRPQGDPETSPADRQ